MWYLWMEIWSFNQREYCVWNKVQLTWYEHSIRKWLSPPIVSATSPLWLMQALPTQVTPSLGVRQAGRVPAWWYLPQPVLVTDCWMHNCSYLVEGLPLHCSWQETNLFMYAASDFEIQKDHFSYDILKKLLFESNTLITIKWLWDSTDP